MNRMKKLRLVYNPFSGERTFGGSLDVCIKLLQEAGYIVCPVRIGDNINIGEALTEDFDAFAVAGGDGTVNIVINLIMKKKLNHIPLAIFPSGTANDFASFLQLPKKPEDICEIIARGETTALDIGRAGSKYFINVCAGGLFSDISTTVDNSLKANIGKLAYYMEAVRQITEYKPLSLKITDSKGKVYNEKAVLFLCLNSSGTDGIKNLSPAASIQDGLFDFLFIRDCDVREIPDLLLKYLTGQLSKNKNILYFKDHCVNIELAEGNKTATDVDGELGDELPLTIENIHRAVKLFI
ncbi:MAG: YegS/Rv2252/BmrU family lipid kinase [Clostridiales bacterium]|nr:YegS/Rv2252/BmrU family lipid kinase [Clostridiales bacterium]